MSTAESTPRDPGQDLMECRNAIEVVDHRIIELLSQRVALGLRAAKAKREAGRPLKDGAREKEVIEHALADARSHGLPEKDVKKIFEHIIDMSRRAQEDAQ